MSSEETQREVHKGKLNVQLKKLKDAIETKNERMVSKHYTNMKTIFEAFENFHIQYLHKSKKAFEDGEQQQIYTEASDALDEAHDIAGEFLERIAEARQLDETIRSRNTDQIKKKEKIQGEMEVLISVLQVRVEELTDPENDLGPAALEKDLEGIEARYLEVLKVFSEFEANSEVAEDLRKFRFDFGELQKTYSSQILKVRTYVERHSTAGSVAGSRSQSPNADRNGNNAFKYKKMEFPKFSGAIRQYSTFKRDFQEMLVEPGHYDQKQLSHVIRNECLSGEAQKLVKNLHRYDDIWKKLDDKYDDQSEVIEIITREITGLKQVEEGEYKAFIDLVNIVEQASLDLAEMDKASVLNNPVTVRLILSKCPKNVQEGVTREFSEKRNESEFDVLLQYLVPRRKDAIRLARIRDETKQVKNKPVKAKQEVNITDSKMKEKSQKLADKSFKCPVQGCSFNRKHFLTECRAFKRLTVDEKGKIVRDQTLCVLCFNKSHDVSSCPRKSSGWKECDVNNCNKWHNRLLHGANVPGLTLSISVASKDDEDNLQTLLLVQDVQVQGQKCLVFWDHGSTTSLVTFDFADRIGLQGVGCELELTGVGDKKNVIESKMYKVPLVTSSGEKKMLKAFGMEKITGDLINLDVRQAAKEFGMRSQDVQRPVGAVDLLIGMENADIIPCKIKTSYKLALYQSLFGTGFLLAGKHDSIKREGSDLSHVVCRTDVAKVKLTDFITAESFGIDLPRRCKNCKGCKECSFRARQITWVENQELATIEDGLVLDVVNKKWTSSYPFKEDPGNLRDNYNQAHACMINLEKRLAKAQQLDSFQVQFSEAVDRGVFRKLTDQEREDYHGPVNYITLTESYKEGAQVTTPIRLCMNSSMKYCGVSLNDILMKGPSSLNDIYSVLLNFRKYEVAFVKDITKFYQSILATERDQHLRRVLWRGGDSATKPDIYITTTVNFGDRPAGCITLTALRKTAELFGHIDEEAAEKLKHDNYVDDICSGGSCREDAERISKNMDLIASYGGFKFKTTTMSGDHTEGSSLKILGTGWHTAEDALVVEIKVNPSEKRKGAKTAPDLKWEELTNDLPVEVTKRVVWRIVLGQFDLLGLLSVFTIRLKLVMRDLCGNEGQKLEWDDPIPETIKGKFLSTLRLMEDVKDIKFPRCLKPENVDNSVEPDLIVFGDGSTQAFCALAYGRWKLMDGSFSCRLITGKTRVAPLRKLSVPRIELLGAVAAVRLANSVEEATGIKFGNRFFFTDSSAVLGMIKGDSAGFQEFVGTRTGEIRSKSDPETEWFWIPTEDNLADMGTRDTVMPSDLKEGSVYQDGKEWMSEEFEFWPCKTDLGCAPSEEMKKVVHVATATFKESVICIKDYSSYSKLLNIMCCVLKFIKMYLGIDKKSPLAEYCTEAENCLIYFEQDQVRVDADSGKLASLFPRKKEVVLFGTKATLIVTSGRIGGGLAVGYDIDELPILYSTSPLSKLIMKHFHDIEHSGCDRTMQRSRSLVWIVRGRRLAKSVRNNCFECKLRHKILEEQLIAPLPESRQPPSPVFNSTAVDLFGPITIKDTVKGRCKKNCWGVLFCCTVTSAIHLEVAEDYSCDSFLLCLKRFFNLRGSPKRIQSDPGSQLVAASKELKNWDFDRITEWSRHYKTVWYFAPTDSQHYNGCAEAMIKVTKNQLNDTVKSRSLTKGELDTLFSDVMFTVNSRPLMKSPGDDTLSGGPITPLHLLGGRSTIQVPTPTFDGNANLTKRLRFLEQIKDEFWKKWFAQVFHNLVPCYKWRTQHRNVQVGDIVLLKDSNVLRNEYRLARVHEVMPSPDDVVRRIKVVYKNLKDTGKSVNDATVDLKKSRFSETERSVQNIVVIVPADWKDDEIEAAVLQDLKVNKV